jgi:hypothetical protein
MKPIGRGTLNLRHQDIIKTMNTELLSTSIATNRTFMPIIIILLSISMLSSQPRRGSVVFNGEFGGSIVWDGFALQEKQLAERMELGMIIDSEGIAVDSGILKYRHWEFGPMVDVTVYILPCLAIGAGYGYGWVDQFFSTHHRLKKGSGGRRLCTSHQLRGQVMYSICLENYDMVDIIGVPFYTFGTVTRVPLPMKIYRNLMPPEAYAFFQELHEPVSYRGFGFEVRVRGRHFLNNYLFAQGSFYGRIQRTDTRKDPLDEFVSTTPQGSFGVTLGLGAMLGGNSGRANLSKLKAQPY